MAQALFERHAPPDIRAESAGQEPAKQVWPEVVEAMREIGIDLSERRPKKLTVEMQLHADWAITLACGASAPTFRQRSRLDIPDPAGKPVEEVRAIRKAVEARVKDLIEHRLDAIRADRTAHQMRLADCYPTSSRSSRACALTARSGPARTPSSPTTRRPRALVRDDDRPQTHARVPGRGKVRRPRHGRQVEVPGVLAGDRLAHKSAGTGAGDGLYEHAGGEQALHALGEAFYARFSPIRRSGRCLSTATASRRASDLVRLVPPFGGPGRFTRELCFEHLIQAHRHLEITDEQRARLVELYMEAPDDSDLPDDEGFREAGCSPSTSARESRSRTPMSRCRAALAREMPGWEWSGDSDGHGPSRRAASGGSGGRGSRQIDLDSSMSWASSVPFHPGGSQPFHRPLRRALPCSARCNGCRNTGHRFCSAKAVAGQAVT